MATKARKKPAMLERVIAKREREVVKQYGKHAPDDVPGWQEPLPWIWVREDCLDAFTATRRPDDVLRIASKVTLPNGVVMCNIQRMRLHFSPAQEAEVQQPAAPIKRKRTYRARGRAA